MNDMFDPGKVGVAYRGRSILPAHVVTQTVTTPIAHVERWIGEDEVGFEVFVQVILEGVCVVWSQVGLNASNSKIHFRQAPGRRVGLLSKNREVAEAASVRLDEFLRLDEHAAGAAAGVVDSALVWFDHLYQQLDHRLRCIELAAAFSFGAGKLAEEVFIDPAEDILRLALFV